ncbi:hypothetical protein ACWDTP_08750 [Mycobacterium sp. NPDC003449]
MGTASRALSGKGYVDEQTRRRVRVAAAQLEYRGNAAARALRERRSRAVGLLIPDLTNEFYTSAAEVLQTELDAEGFQLIVAQTRGLIDEEREAWESMLSRQVDGVVHVPVDPSTPVPKEIPVVQLRSGDGNERARPGGCPRRARTYATHRGLTGASRKRAAHTDCRCSGRSARNRRARTARPPR